MNQPSNFQLEHPLSAGKKFWKKLIDKSILNFFLSLIFGLIIGYGIYFILININVDSNLESTLLFSIALGIPITFLFLNIIYGIYVKMYIKRYYYDCGERFITIKKGVFAPTEIHVQYPKIQDVYVDQDILDRIMGLYDVHIASATATSGIEAHIDGVSAEVAESIKNIILDKILTENSKTNNVDSNPQMPQTPSVPPVNFSEKISSANYPITSSWIVAVLINYFLSTLIWTVIVLAFFREAITGLSANIDSVWKYGLLIFALIYLFRVVYLFIWKSNYYFELTPDFILMKTGVISRQESHLPYKAIQNVSTVQGIVERIFGLGSVVAENAASVVIDQKRGTTVQSGVSIVGQSIQNAEHLNQVLNQIVVSVRNSSSTGL